LGFHYSIFQYSIIQAKGVIMEICFLELGHPTGSVARQLGDPGGRWVARILLDCGRACVQQMARLNIGPAASPIVSTHGHYDHVADYALLVLTSWRFRRSHTLQSMDPGAKAMSDALFQEAYKIDIAARKI
jgi:ribonuclease BN (tRNA processing enzyme)